MKRSVLGISLAILIQALGGIAISSLSAEELGEIKNFVHLGESDGWGGAIKKDVYWLENSQDAGAIRYYYTPYTEGEGGARSVQVDVNVQSMKPDSRAGLLYGYQQSSRTYYMMLIGPGGEFDVYHRSVDGLQRTMGSSFTLPATEFIRIEIMEKGREVSLRVNGQSTGSFESRGTGAGSLGIAALGMGKFGFTNYQQTPARETTKSPAETRSDLLSPPAGNTRPAVALKPETSLSQRRDVTFQNKVDPTTGMVKFRVPLPKGWQIDPDPNTVIEIVGPDNIMVYQQKPAVFAYTNDPSSQNLLRRMGKQVHPVISLQEYLNRYMLPGYRNKGHRLIKSYPVPEVAHRFETISNMVPKVSIQRRTMDVLGTEWELNDGRRAFVLLSRSVEYGQDSYGVDMIFWNVSYYEVVTPRERFKYARDAMIYASANIEMNPKFVRFQNNKMLADIERTRRQGNEALRQSRQAHLQRMNAITERGRTSSSIAKTYSDILDINHAGYLKRSDMVSTGQSKSIDAIGERSIIGNGNTGEQYQVDSGSRHYWINNNGEYIGTDNSLFDPRSQKGLNDLNWQQFEVVK